MASHYRLHEREQADRAAAKPLDGSAVRAAVDAMAAEDHLAEQIAAVARGEKSPNKVRSEEAAAVAADLAAHRSLDLETAGTILTELVDADLGLARHALPFPISSFSQRARDVAETLAFLDHETPDDVVTRALDLWAEQTIAERDDVATIVRVVTKNRMAATS